MNFLHGRATRTGYRALVAMRSVNACHQFPTASIPPIDQAHCKFFMAVLKFFHGCFGPTLYNAEMPPLSMSRCRRAYLPPKILFFWP